MAKMGDLVRTLEGETRRIQSIAITFDNKHIVSGSEGKSIKIWNFESGELIRTLMGHENTVYSLAITTDNKYIASGSSDNSIKVWDFETGELIRTLSGHTNSVTSVAITLNNKYIVSGSFDSTIKIWELESGKLIRTLTGHTNYIRCIAISSDDKYIISGSEDKTMKIWDFEGNLIKSINTSQVIYSLRLSEDKRYIVSGLTDGLIKIWDFEGNFIKEWTTPHKVVRDLVLSSDNTYVVTAGALLDGISIWNLATSELIIKWDELGGAVSSLATTTDNKYIASGSYDTTIKIWNFVDSKYYLKLKNNQLLDKDNNPITLPITDELLEEKGILKQNITQDIINQVLSNEIQLVSNKPFNIDLKANKDLSLDKNLHNGEVFILKKEENVPIAKIKGYTSPQLMLPTKDIKFNRLKNVNDINIKANDNDNKVKIIFSIDSGKTWKSKKMTNEGYANREIDIEDFTDISENGMTIREFNSIKTNWTEDLVMSGKVRFGYFLEIDNTNTISEVDEIKANIGLYGGWDSKINGIDFTVNYTNEELKVEILKNGTYKINYLQEVR